MLKFVSFSRTSCTFKSGTSTVCHVAGDRVRGPVFWRAPLRNICCLLKYGIRQKSHTFSLPRILCRISSEVFLEVRGSYKNKLRIQITIIDTSFYLLINVWNKPSNIIFTINKMRNLYMQGVIKMWVWEWIKNSSKYMSSKAVLFSKQ